MSVTQPEGRFRAKIISMSHYFQTRKYRVASKIARSFIMRLLFWGYLKIKVPVDKPRDIGKLNMKIQQEIAIIPLDRVMQHFNVQPQERIDRREAHLANMILKI